MPEFKADRWRQLDATDEEVAQLSDEFERSDVSAQTFLNAYLTATGDSELRDHLEDLRASGHFDKSEEKTDQADGGAPDESEDDGGAASELAEILDVEKHIKASDTK